MSLAGASGRAHKSPGRVSVPRDSIAKVSLVTQVKVGLLSFLQIKWQEETSSRFDCDDNHDDEIRELDEASEVNEQVDHSNRFDSI